MGLGLVAGNMDLLMVVPDEITARLQPNLLDLGITITARAIATYANVNSGAVSSMAGTAIAMALVPPFCEMGIILADGELDNTQGADLLFSANLSGIFNRRDHCSCNP